MKILGYQKEWLKKRYLIVFLAFLGYINLYLLRVNLSVAILAMTDNSTVSNQTSNIPIFDWNSREKGIILSSFFYGYILTQLMGGFTATKFGGNIVFGFGLAITSIACILTPYVAKVAGVKGIIAIRVLQGITSGISLPSCHVLFAQWAPENERSRMISLAFSGIYFGTVISNLVSGALAVRFGWPSIFYVFGTIGLVWFLVWTIIVRKSPEHDKFITRQEKKYIMSNLNIKPRKNFNTPWKKIFTSVPILALAIINICSNWGFYTLLTQLPSYLKNTLKFQLAATGFLSAVPYLIMGVLLAIAGFLSDWLKMKEYLTATQIKKTFLVVSFFFQGAALLLVGYITDELLCVTLITISIGSGAFSLTGNPLDLAPQYAGIIIGITNTLGTIPGIVSPYLTGVIVTHSTVEEWRTVFFIAAGVYAFGMIFYGCFASGELQPWAIHTNVVERRRSNEPKLSYDNDSFDNTKF